MSAPSTEDGLWIGDLFARCWDHLTQSDVNRIITAGIREALRPGRRGHLCELVSIGRRAGAAGGARLLRRRRAACLEAQIDHGR
jgi:hypothetical protein